MFKQFHNQAKPEFTFNGQWMAVKICDNIDNLTAIELCVRGIVTNNFRKCQKHKDKELKNNLKKTPKSSYLALHPGNNKHNVRLALAVLHETTITAARSYFPNRRDVASFLNFQHLVDYFEI